MASHLLILVAVILSLAQETGLVIHLRIHAKKGGCTWVLWSLEGWQLVHMGRWCVMINCLRCFRGPLMTEDVLNIHPCPSFLPWEKPPMVVVTVQGAPVTDKIDDEVLTMLRGHPVTSRWTRNARPI
ncbi:hypothetical protein EDB83DRAFT_187199 [Lactarius deliciosus]|nr:hypothetical protein EDB83DRAFT_187199 [Lactarius deliciosus]